MACARCGGRRKQRHGPEPTRKVSTFRPGSDVKLKYLRESRELLGFEGPATRREYVVGGRINLVAVDSRDLSTGISWAPGLLEMTDDAGAKLFEFHRPLREEVEAEAKAKAIKEKAWADAEALALPPEEPKPRRRKAKAKMEVPDGEGAVPGD